MTTPAKSVPAKTVPDWGRIERDYRAGVRSVREIAATQGVAHSTVLYRAKAQGWDRELSKKVEATADAMVAEAMVASGVASAVVSSVAKVAVKEGVDSNAARVVDVQLGHRKDVARLRALIMALTSELETPADDMSLQHRIDCAKKLAETQKTLIGLEREAYGIDRTTGEENKMPSGLGHFYAGRHA